MHYLDLYTGFLILIAFIYIMLFLYSINLKNNTLTIIFSLLSLFSTIYIIGAALQLNADSLEQIKFFQKLKYFGLSFMPVFWLIFSIRIYFKKTLSFKTILIILVIPFRVLFLVVTNEFHHLHYAEVSAFNYKGYLITDRIPGSIYYLNSIYSLLILLFSIYVFYRMWHKADFKIKSPYFGLFWARICSLFLIIFYLSDKTPLGIDLLPLGYFISALAYAVAIFHFNLFDVKEIYKDEIFSNLNEGLIITDSNSLLIDYNKKANETFNWLREINKGKPLFSFAEAKRILEADNSIFTLSFEKEGQKKYYEFRKTELEANNRSAGYAYIFLDVTEKKEILKRLKINAEKDGLTDIYNRRKIMEEAERSFLTAKRNSGNLSFVIIDIDYFKKVNDNYGHQAGDYIIKEVTKISKSSIRKNDIIGRYGGEEFLIILPATNSSGAFKVAEKIRSSIENTEFKFKGKTISITISVGIASVNLNSGSKIEVDQIINQADQALYKAKDEGRNMTKIN